MATFRLLAIAAFLSNIGLGLAAVPMLPSPNTGAYIYLCDYNETEYNITHNYYDYIPPTWSKINFTQVDILYVATGGVQWTNGSFGLYNSYLGGFNGSLAFNNSGNLAIRFNWAVATARSQNPKFKIMISQWPNVQDDIARKQYWGYDLEYLVKNTTNSTIAIQTYADSVAAFVQRNNIDGYDIDYEGTVVMRQTKQILSSVRASLDVMSRATGRTYYVTAAPNTIKYLNETVPTLSIVNMMNYGGIDTAAFTGLGLNVSQLTYGFCGETSSGGGCLATDTNTAISIFKAKNLRGYGNGVLTHQTLQTLATHNRENTKDRSIMLCIILPTLLRRSAPMREMISDSEVVSSHVFLRGYEGIERICTSKQKGTMKLGAET